MTTVNGYVPSATPTVASVAVTLTSSSSPASCAAVASSPPAMPTSLVAGSSVGGAGKDSRWLTLEVCREHVRRRCTRSEDECRFAHPPPHVEVQNGRVICCFDSIKGRCQRSDPPCKYLHPPQHLKEQLLQNGRNNLILRNLHQFQRVHPLPPAAAIYSFVSPYMVSATGTHAGTGPCYAPFYATPATAPSQCVATSAAAATANQNPDVQSDDSGSVSGVVTNGLDAATVTGNIDNNNQQQQQYWTIPPQPPSGAGPGTTIYAVDAANNATSYISPLFFQNVAGTGTATGLLLKPHHQQTPAAVVGDGKNGYAVYSCASPIYPLPVSPPHCFPMGVAAGPPLVGSAAGGYHHY